MRVADWNDVDKTDFLNSLHEYRSYVVHSDINQSRVKYHVHPTIRAKQRVTMPPGWLIGAVANFLCSQKTYDLIAKPAIADMQHEYFEALAEGRKIKAVWVRVRGVLSFWLALGAARIAKAALNVWRNVHSV